MSDKVTTLREAISAHLKEGDTVFFSGMQHGEPSAAIHEIARQGIRHLTVISALTHTVGILVSEGLVDRILTGFLQQDEKTVYPMARARRLGKAPIIEEYSHLGICLALLAGQMNVPFIPTRALIASDIVKYNPNLTTVKCPFTDDQLTAVKSVRPDVAILHTQRSDADGNAQKWGSLGVDVEGIGASKKVIVTTEEIVDSDVIRRQPNMTIVPGFRVVAVVEQPWGAYPLHLAGCYNGDIRGFLTEVRPPEGFEAYLREYVHGVSSWEEYLEKRKTAKGEDYFASMRIKEPLWSTPIATGY